jgi:hypothetical protein
MPPSTIYIDGTPHIVQRIILDDLVDWREALCLRPVRPLGGRNTWPPAILYERIPSANGSTSAT